MKVYINIYKLHLGSGVILHESKPQHTAALEKFDDVLTSHLGGPPKSIKNPSKITILNVDGRLRILTSYNMAQRFSHPSVFHNGLF
jgi:hypothetical protein